MQQEPNLEKPGAGLPLIERLVARYYFVGYQFPRLKWEGAVRFFEAETEKIVSLLGPLSSDEVSKKILVPRMRGLEDSSRFWSASMLVEHLVVVASGMAQITILLSQGKTPGIAVDIAKVKPQGQMFHAVDGKTMAREFSQKMKALVVELASGVQDPASPTRHPHPWFGPISAHQWNWLMGAHQRIHRRQLERIAQGAKTMGIPHAPLS